jgi:hypothetical protein
LAKGVGWGPLISGRPETFAEISHHAVVMIYMTISWMMMLNAAFIYFVELQSHFIMPMIMVVVRFQFKPSI